MLKRFRGCFLLLLTALIWGSAFVAQSEGMRHIGPFTFNCIRTLLGGIVLIPVICGARLLQKGRPPQHSDRSMTLKAWKVMPGFILRSSESH